jgi:hypothetical protein
MAQNSATVIVEGNVVKHERKAGSFADQRDPSRTVTFDYIEARLVTPAFDVLEVRFPSDATIPVPLPDELVRLHCDARVSYGNLKLTVQAVQPSLAVA